MTTLEEWREKERKGKKILFRKVRGEEKSVRTKTKLFSMGEMDFMSPNSVELS